MQFDNRDPVVLVAKEYADEADELKAYSPSPTWEAPAARPAAEQREFDEAAVKGAPFAMRCLGNGVFETANEAHTGYVRREPTVAERNIMQAASDALREMHERLRGGRP